MAELSTPNPKGFLIEESVLVADRGMTQTYQHRSGKLFTIRKDNPSLVNNLPSPTVPDAASARIQEQQNNRVRVVSHPDILSE